MAYTLTPAERRARAQSLRENRENRKLYYDYLEKKANVQLESLKAIYRGEDKIPAEKLSNLLYRELPVNNINIAPQKMVIKRRFDSFGFYS